MEYRKAQLQKLKEEVVDLEDMNTGISITDLGLNDYRMDLLEYIKENGNLDYVVNGMHSVVSEDKENGVILYRRAILFEEKDGVKNIVSIPVLDYLNTK